MNQPILMKNVCSKILPLKHIYGYRHIQERNWIKVSLCLISVVHYGQVYFANKRYHCWSRTATLSVLIGAIGLEQEV